MVQFATRLSAMRQAKNLSQTQLAQVLGVTKVTVWNWERGLSHPRPKNLRALARVFEVSPSQFANGHASLNGHQSLPALSSYTHLSEAIAAAKSLVAQAAGIDPTKITISLDY